MSSSGNSVAGTTVAKAGPSTTTNTTTTTTNSSKAPVKEYLYKILVVGDLGTGKTSIIKRYVHNIFSMNYKSTIGVDFALKVLQYSNDTVVRLQLWDIAGQERFGNMTRVYYKEAVGALVVFDVTRSSTFDGVSKWKNDIDEKVRLADGSKIPVILLANKVDLEKDPNATPTEEDLKKLVVEKEFVGHFETSAKQDKNISEALKALVAKILENDKMLAEKGAKSNAKGKNGVVRVDSSNQSNNASGSGSTSCCS